MAMIEAMPISHLSEHDPAIDLESADANAEANTFHADKRFGVDATNPTDMPSKLSYRYRNDSGYASQRSNSSISVKKLSSGDISVPALPEITQTYSKYSFGVRQKSRSELPTIEQSRHSVEISPLEKENTPQTTDVSDTSDTDIGPDVTELEKTIPNKFVVLRQHKPKSFSLPTRFPSAGSLSTSSVQTIEEQAEGQLELNLSPEFRCDILQPKTPLNRDEISITGRDSADGTRSPKQRGSIQPSLSPATSVEVLPITRPAAAHIQPPSRPFDIFDEIDVEQAGSPIVVASEAAVKSEAQQVQDGTVSDGIFTRFVAAFYRTYAPRVEPALILPSGPTDVEKISYLSTKRVPLYAAGVFSFLSLTAGMWLFTISCKYFAWFGVFCGALQIYMGISYYVGLVGKDFDIENHRKLVKENPIDADSCPSVDIYLPVCKEPLEILENTWKYVSQIDYPKHKLKVYVLDDGAMDSVRDMAARFNFEYIVRGDRPRLKKAGNLRWAFSRTQGDFFNIYDADFCPRADILRELIPRMLADPEIALLQTPQFFRTSSDQTWVEQGAGAIQELFYRVIQVNRDRWGASICVGSNALYRRVALEEVGGTAEIGFSEDVHTGFGCVDRGWKVNYIPLCLACGICPDSPRAFFSQQMRWCMGSTTLLSNPHFWTSKLTRMQKMCYLCGFLYYSAVALSIFVNPLPGIFLLWLRPDMFKYYNLAFAIPSLLYTLLCFRFWAKASYGLNVQYIQVIQSYAYLTAIKDRIFGRALQWAPTGDSKAHKNNKYRNMRILAWSWLFTWGSALIAGMVFQISRGMAWWNCIPLLTLDLFNFFLAHRFLLCA